MFRELSSGRQLNTCWAPPTWIESRLLFCRVWRVLDGTMHHSPFRRRWTGGTATVNGMEERDRVDASTNLCSQLWLLLAGDISVLARLTLTDCVHLFSYSTVAVTGRRHLRPRPVDFVISFYPTCGCHWSEETPPSPG